jgi:hypothetical protein
MEDPMSKPALFYDFSLDEFPFTVSMHDPGTGEILWEQTVTGPGVLDVQGQGRPVIVFIEFPDGYAVIGEPE